MGASIQPVTSLKPASGVMAIINKILTDHVVWLLLVIMFIVGTLVDPVFISLKNILNIISHAAPLTMMVFGMSFLLMLGRIDLSMESTFAIAPIVANLLVMRWCPAFPPILTVIICLAIGLAIGAFNGFLSVKLGINDFLVGLAMLLFLRGVVLTLIPEGLYNLPKVFTYLGSTRFFTNFLPLDILVMLLVFIILYLLTKYRPFGRHLLATGSNREAAFIGGINVDKVQMIAFIMAGGFAAFAGMLTAGRQLSCTNGMGDGSIMQVLAAVVLGGIAMTGGKGTILGAFGGAILLQTIDNVLTLSGIDPLYQDAIYGFLLLLAIIFQGIQQGKRRNA
ncbi:MAG: ABC transporter permease [Bacillota bacterium]